MIQSNNPRNRESMCVNIFSRTLITRCIFIESQLYFFCQLNWHILNYPYEVLTRLCNICCIISSARLKAIFYHQRSLYHLLHFPIPTTSKTQFAAFCMLRQPISGRCDPNSNLSVFPGNF